MNLFDHPNTPPRKNVERLWGCSGIREWNDMKDQIKTKQDIPFLKFY